MTERDKLHAEHMAAYERFKKVADVCRKIDEVSKLLSTAHAEAHRAWKLSYNEVKAAEAAYNEEVRRGA